MDGNRPPPVPRSRFRQFKNPPQPHMCIADNFKDSRERLYINVLGWQKIPNPKKYSDPIPLYGGMRVLQGNTANEKPPLSVFAVMVNPDILKVNGKNAANPLEREALVNLMCDFVEAMNPGVLLARRPVVLPERDLTGELKDVWLAVQAKREREKGANSDYVYKVYDIDGVAGEEGGEEESTASYAESSYAESSHAADEQGARRQRRGVSDQPLRDPRAELHHLEYYESSQCGAGRRRLCEAKPDTNGCSTQRNGDFDSYNGRDERTSSYNGRDERPSPYNGRDECTNSYNGREERQNSYNGRDERPSSYSGREEPPNSYNGRPERQSSYDFYPVFAEASRIDNTDLIEPMKKLGLETTDSKCCDNKAGECGSVRS